METTLLEAECLECGNLITSPEDEVDIGEIITCDECGLELVISDIADHHITLSLAPEDEEEEDWEE